MRRQALSGITANRRRDRTKRGYVADNADDANICGKRCCHSTSTNDCFRCSLSLTKTRDTRNVDIVFHFTMTSTKHAKCVCVSKRLLHAIMVAGRKNASSFCGTRCLVPRAVLASTSNGLGRRVAIHVTTNSSNCTPNICCVHLLANCRKQRTCAFIYAS